MAQSKRDIKGVGKPREETKNLGQQLGETRAINDTKRSEKLDALVVSHEGELKIYPQHEADSIYRILIEKMHEGAVTLNRDGIVLFCNSCFADMLKLPLQKVIGTPLSNVIAKEWKAQFSALLGQGWEKGVKIEISLNDSEGAAIPVLIAGNGIQVHGKEIRSIIVTDLSIPNKYRQELQDRSKQLEQKNKELENANQDLTSFTYVSSHDLQEPLRKIQSFVSLIVKGDEKNLTEKGKGYFKKVQQTAKRMQTLLTDLLTYSSTKVAERVFENVGLDSILQGVIDDLEELIKEKNATIEVLPIGHASVIPFQFRQLMQNLIMNSLKFSKPDVPPHITIKSNIVQGNSVAVKGLLPEKKYLNITFSDNGIGFDPQYKDRIFEVFQRLHSIDEYKGTGIGLAICKRIIENHNGAMAATGELGKGAQFDIYLPV